MKSLPWQNSIPEDAGALPLGGRLVRTDPSGSNSTKIAILGVYPAVTQTKTWTHEDKRYNLPFAVERNSFQSDSASGKELDNFYFNQLGFSRTDALIFDMMPYYFASTSATGESKRSMWDNVQLYKAKTNETLAVQERPEPDALIALCSSMPGNRERLTSIVAQANSLRVLLTLGNEAAAFVRQCAKSKDAQIHLYSDPISRDVFGRALQVIHLAHPGILMKNMDWKSRHLKWCESIGRELITKLLR